MGSRFYPEAGHQIFGTKQPSYYSEGPDLDDEDDEMKVRIYTRVSTDGQDANHQVIELCQWAETQGHQIITEYQDVPRPKNRW